MQNLDRFYTTSDFDRKYLRKDSRYPKLESYLIETDSSSVRRNKPVNFSPLSRKFDMWVWTHPNRIYSADYISASRGCYPLKYLHALDIHQGLIAHITGCSQRWTPPLGSSFPRQGSSTSLRSFVSCTDWRLQSGLHSNNQSSCTSIYIHGSAPVYLTDELYQVADVEARQ